jgi:hypothetical protein
MGQMFIYQVQFGDIVDEYSVYDYSYWDLEVAEKTYVTYEPMHEYMRLFEYTIEYDKDNEPIILKTKILKSKG